MSKPRRVRPATGPVDARVRLPGSKSLTIRALAAAALADGRSHIYGALRSEDTGAMARCLLALGVDIREDMDPWTVEGTGGHLDTPASALDAGESALSARVLAAMAALGHGEIVVDGVGSLRRRPMQGLVDALASWGVEVRSNGFVPVTVSGRGGLHGSPVSVDATVSSQFTTAVLLVAPLAETASEIRVDGLGGSRGYLDLTVGVMRSFGAAVAPTITGFVVEPTGYRPTDFVVEPDGSSATYPMLAAAITGGKVVIEGLDLDSSQPDVAVAQALAEMGCSVAADASGIIIEGPRERLRPLRGDLSASPDGALALAIACLFADGSSRLDGLASLRHKESDRMRALVEEIRRLGGRAEIDGDAVVIAPGDLHAAVIDPHGDHRVAMAFATAGLSVHGLEVSNPDVVAKTWPGFWDMLDALAG